MDMNPATQRQRQKQAPRTGLSWPWCTGLLCDSKSPRAQGLWPGGMMWMMMWLLPYYMRIRKPDNCHAEILMHWNIIIGKCAIVVWFPFTCAHTLTVSVFVCMCVCVSVYCIVYSHHNVPNQSGSLSLSIMFGVLLLPVDATTRPCPALPCPSLLHLPLPRCLHMHIRYLCHITS